MNHHEAQVIATSYALRAAAIGRRDDEAPLAGFDVLSRSAAMIDHSAVWQRVADALKPKEAP